MQPIAGNPIHCWECPPHVLPSPKNYFLQIIVCQSLTDLEEGKIYSTCPPPVFNNGGKIFNWGSLKPWYQLISFFSLHIYNYINNAFIVTEGCCWKNLGAQSLLSESLGKQTNKQKKNGRDKVRTSEAVLALDTTNKESNKQT